MSQDLPTRVALLMSAQANKARALDAIERHRLTVFHPEKRRGDDLPKWTVRQEDANGNTLVQVRSIELRFAIFACAAQVMKLERERMEKPDETQKS